MKILFYIIGGIILFVLYVRFLEKTSVFYPEKKIAMVPSDIGLNYDDVTIVTSDNVRINAWHIKQPNSKKVILFFHGNAGNIGDRVGKISIFSQLGLDVLIVDYRGFGKSEGKPSEEGIYLDAEASFKYLKEEKGYDSEDIIVYGASLGGAVAVDLATKQDVASLILDSTFSNAADIAKRIYPFVPSFMLNIKLDSMSKIKELRIPKLFIHSKDDNVVPLELGRKLFEAALEPKDFVEVHGDHIDGHIYDEKKFSDSIKNFIR